MNKDKVGTYSFVAEPFHVDFTGRLTIGTLGNHLLNCAGVHAKEKGFGMSSLNQHQYTWVLSRLVIELEDLPRQYETFYIQTWVENVYRLFTDRNFAILDQTGQAIGYARSVWAMISMETRKPIDLITLHEGSITEYICNKPCPIDKPGRIKIAATEPCYEYQTRYNDIDINGHVNSIRYMEHMLNLFPLEKYREQRVRRFAVAYVAESYYGDTLSFQCCEPEKDSFGIEIRKNHTIPVCRGKIQFEQIHSI